MLLAFQVRAENVVTCDQVSLARPGHGAAYRGTVKNSDYGLSAAIPREFTGWGAAIGAPFHGFIIYLDNHQGAQAACIDFRVALHVELPEDLPGPLPQRSKSANVRVGNLTGRETSDRGSVNGTQLVNETITVQRERSDGTDDVTITFVSPTAETGRTKPTFERFLSHLRFE
jgi:hypothetical protein